MIDWLLLALAWATLLLVIAVYAELAYASRVLVFLRDLPPPSDSELPSLSVVIAARDEARKIEQALRSVLAQDYPGMEIVVVDDRSTDGTGEILERIRQEQPRLHVLHVAQLPEGWIGKNHALQRGAEAARGELLLFTDADVVFHPTALRRAAGHMERHALDHLAAAPEVRMPGPLLRLFGVVFGLFFSLFTRPWRVRDPHRREHVGIGAFNLLRASAYRAIGGHEPIRLRPDDDLKLGKLVKRNGLRQDFVVALGMVSVEWYSSLREVMHGLRKNSFAGLGYRVDAVLGFTLLMLLVYLWPLAALALTEGWVWGLNLAIVALQLLLFAGAAHQQETPPIHALLYPLVVGMLIAIVWRSMLYTLRHRGIEWRGTHYPLEELRRNRV